MSVNERKDKTGKIREVSLGLSAEEQKVLDEARVATANDVEINDLRDATLARYLRVNKWKVEPALQQLREYLEWRKSSDIDNILANPNFPLKETLRIVIPYAYHGEDKEARPIYIEKTGQIAAAALADPIISVPEHLLHAHVYGVELMQRRMYENSLRTGERINGITTILDFDGLGFHHRNCLFVLQKLMEFDKKFYPEYLGKLYVINLPWVGTFLWSAVQVFLDDTTKQRMQMISGNPNEFLLSVISPEHLPPQYGGNCDGIRCEHGGLGANHFGTKGCIDVMYSSKLRPAGVADDEGLDTHTVTYDFEKIVQAEKEGDVFSWYFEVGGDASYDIDFSVELLPVSGEASKKTYIEKVKRLKTGKGSFKAPFPGARLLFRWDNNFSWMSNKELKYNLSCQPASESLTSLLNQATSPKSGTSPKAGAAASAAAASR